MITYHGCILALDKNNLMKKIFCIFIILISCNKKTDKKVMMNSTNLDTIKSKNEEVTVKALINIDTILFQKIIYKNFSSIENKDKFELKFIRKGVKSKCVFTIDNSNGETIYIEDISASDFLPHNSKKLSQIDLEEKVIIRCNIFLDDKYFSYPGIEEDYDEDYTDLDSITWKKLRLTELPGFSYAIGDESIMNIMWNPFENKVVVYMYCC